jgi:branched-chain amino acid transport system substrate-binding protein
MGRKAWRTAVLTLWLGFSAGLAAAQQGQVVLVGGLCDRTGATSNIGVENCAGVGDYFALANSQAKLPGHRLQYIELDHAYMVDRAADAYDQLKRQGVVAVFNFGVPILEGLTTRYMADKIPAFTPGTGSSEAIDGETWPYVFPGTSQYWSQAGAAMKYLKDNGARKGARIAYLYYDNPAGRQGIAMVDAIAAIEGYQVQPFAIKPPGLEVAPQVNAIKGTFKADWVITSVFGRSPAVVIREFKKAGFPLNRVIGFVWGTGDTDIEEAGWDTAQGFLGLQFAAIGRDPAVIRDIIKMRQDQGKDVPKFVGSVYYNRGVLTAALMTEGIRLAIQNHGAPVTGDKVRRGLEEIRNFDAHGLAAPLNISPQDHEGGGHLKVYQVKGNAWVPVSDWIRGYRNEVMAQVKKANNK